MVETVVKVGGGLLADPGALDAVLASLLAASRSHRLLVVPGGGPFADAVRDADRRVGLTSTAAHWMAVLAMDQYAQLIAAKLADSAIVDARAAIAVAIESGRVPVLAPSRWLREADPLPHSWDVTSDSIAAWVAGQVGARQLMLVKPSAVSEPAVDAYFQRALPDGLHVQVLTANQVSQAANFLG